MIEICFTKIGGFKERINYKSGRYGKCSIPTKKLGWLSTKQLPRLPAVRKSYADATCGSGLESGWALINGPFLKALAKKWRPPSEIAGRMRWVSILKMATLCAACLI